LGGITNAGTISLSAAIGINLGDEPDVGVFDSGQDCRHRRHGHRIRC
jgi:hypothetical protein